METKSSTAIPKQSKPREVLRHSIWVSRFAADRIELDKVDEIIREVESEITDCIRRQVERRGMRLLGQITFATRFVKFVENQDGTAGYHDSPRNLDLWTDLVVSGWVEAEL